MILRGRGKGFHNPLVAPATFGNPVAPATFGKPVASATFRNHPFREREMNPYMVDTVTMERILIIDDHPLVRDGLRSVISISFDNCQIFEAASMDDALATLEKQSNFDLVLLDLHIPDVRRLDGLRLLRARFPILPVVMVSGAFDSAIVQEALAAGAAGFIPKSMKRSAIVEALHRIVAGEIFLPETVDDVLAEHPERSDIMRRIDSLTPQQKVVLNHLVNGRLNKQIAHDLGVSMTTIKAHVSAILQKLGVLSRTQAVIKANQVDFRLD